MEQKLTLYSKNFRFAVMFYAFKIKVKKVKSKTKFKYSDQARSQEFEMGGCFGGLGAEPPALENFAFFCKNN